MKLRYSLLKGCFTLGLLGLMTLPSFAQIDEVQDILKAGIDDVNTLARAYLKPFGSGFGAGLNTGWTNTAKPHRMLGFDVTVSTGLAVVPTSDRSFNVTNLDFERLKYEDGPMQSPTINGANEAGSIIGVYHDLGGPNEQKLFDFTMPSGLGYEYVPAPMLKVGIGLVKNSEVMVRYLPPIDHDDYGSFEMFGVGLKHGINQWLPAGKLIPVDLSVMLGYTSMDLSANLSLTPQDIVSSSQVEDTNPEAWEGQSIAMKSDAYTFNVLVGKTLPMISVYGGIGYESSTLNITTVGSYPNIVPNPDYQADPDNEKPFLAEEAVDPIDLEFDGENGFHGLAGFRVRFAVFHVSASYTLAKYSSLNVGLGISFR